MRNDETTLQNNVLRSSNVDPHHQIGEVGSSHVI